MDEQAEGVWGGESVGLKVGRLGSWFQKLPPLVERSQTHVLSDVGSLPARGQVQCVGGDLASLVLFDCTSTKPLLIQHRRVFFI